MRRTFFVVAAIAVLGVLVTALALNNKQSQSDTPFTYHVNKGFVFGTYFNIRYSYSTDLKDTIEHRLSDIDFSLSTFNPNSTISRINKNESTETDFLFDNMYVVATRVSELSRGAFDITVAPLVNLWGFGFKNKQDATTERINSILPLVGYQKIKLEDHQLLKQDPGIELDASGVAKGYACDVIADMLRSMGISNYLVDIGGEVVCLGVNDQHQPWAIGITKPIDDTTGQQSEIEAVVHSTHLAMATSGNYRQFYYENGVRRSHTIDPRTGYPVDHTLLSATIVAPTCAEADALATACMVMGDHEALQLINSLQNTECYLIVYDSKNEKNKTILSSGMAKYLTK